MSGRRLEWSTSGGDLIWLGLAAIYLGFRISAAVQLPVAGAELSTLAGAWQESLGLSDGRYEGTLLQTISSPLLALESEAWLPRLVVLGVSGIVPLSLWLVRRELGEPAALAFLALVAVDPAAILMGSTGAGAAFDTSVSLAVLAASLRGVRNPLIWGLLGVFAASGGAGPVILLASAAALALMRGDPLDRRLVAGCAIGAALGVTFVSLVAPEGSLRVPPFRLVDAGLTEEWAGAGALQLAALYELPIVLGGTAAAAHIAARLAAGSRTGRSERLLLVWAAGAALLWLAAGSARDPSLVLALTLPLCGLLAAGLARLPAAIASEPRLPRRRAAALALVVLLAAGTAVQLSGAFAVARGAHNESLISPWESASARSLREHVLRLAADSPGGIVVHPDLRAAVVWPFRESATLTVSSTVPRGDAVVVWPREALPPQGYEDSGGIWFLTRTVAPPGGSPGDVIHWFRQRNRIETSGTAVRVYTGSTP